MTLVEGINGTTPSPLKIDNNGKLEVAMAFEDHAANHTDGTDDIQNATAAQKGLATAAQITKLDGIDTGAKDDQTGAEIKTLYEAEADTNAYDDAAVSKLGGIEASADVTDAIKIASSIVGTAAKETPIDADTVPIIDSADSSSLKEVLWSQIKATLKAYFDGIYPAKAHDLDSHNSCTLDQLSTDISDDSVVGLAADQVLTNKVIRLDSAPLFSSEYEGITINAQVGENVVFGDLLYMKGDTKWWKASSAVASSAEFPVSGMAVATILANASGNILLEGTLYSSGFNFTTTGKLYCGVDVPTHTIPSTSGHSVQIIGVSLSTDKMLFKPDSTYIELA